MSKETALVTGASSGIGAVYAEKLAARGHDLILVARRGDKLQSLAERLRTEAGISVEVLEADLSDAAGLEAVEQRLKRDDAITMLVNNAGIAGEGPILTAQRKTLDTMIDLNVKAVTRLAAAIAPRLAERGSGTIVNITSVTALMPDGFTAVYPATKAFVLAFSEALNAELGPRGVRVQAVLPGVTKTDIWEEEALKTIPAEMVMDVNDMVSAALRGLDLGETVTIPSLPDNADWEELVRIRTNLRPNLSRNRPAARYS